jgi:hypothetical protein
MKATLVSKNCIHLLFGRSALLLVPLLFACFALSPQARAVCLEGCLGSFSTVLGNNALESNAGSNNTASGFLALANNTTGGSNTASGYQALVFNTTGSANTASGFQALFSNTTGSNNLANGFQALFNNTTGFNNMATGSLALRDNTTGIYNMANGSNAMVFNTTGSNNVAEGLNSLRFNTTGNSNTAVGLSALLNNTTGSFNVALGGSAGSSRTTGSNNIDISNVGVAGESNAIRIGKAGLHQATYIAGISGKVVAGGVGVIVDGNGHLGTIVSSQRFKTAIKPIEQASEAILALKPVTFRYKKELDPEGIPQFGLVAEEVEKVNPDLVARDPDGKAYTVRYEAVNAMLLNEFLKEHRKVESLEKQLKAAEAKQEEKISALTELVKEQAAQIQKVSAQLEVNKTASQIVLNNQ